MAEATTDAPTAPPAPPAPPPPPANPGTTLDNSWQDAVPEKFRRDTLSDSLKAWNDSYKGLEQRLHQPKGPLSLDAQPEPGSFEEAAKLSGLEVDDLLADFNEHGKLSKEHAEKLSRFIKPGMANEMLRGVVASRKAFEAETKAYMASAVEAAGGETELGVLMSRAQAELSPEDIDALRPLLEDDSGNAKKTAPMAVRMIQNMLNAQDGTDKSRPLLGSGGASNAPGITIRGPEDLNALMSDKRYNEDAAYRKAVIKAYQDFQQGR